MFEWIKKIKKEIKVLNNILDKDKKDSVIQSMPSVANLNKAKKLIDNQNFDSAQEILLKSLETNKDALTYKYLGKIREFKKDYKKAIEYYNESAKLAPLDKEIMIRLGMCYLYSAEFEKSIESFESAQKTNPANTDLYTGWGMALMRQKKYALAKEKFYFATKLNKYNYSALLFSAIMEMRLKEYNLAQEKLEFLIKTAPNEASFLEYANLLLFKENYDKALAYAKKAIELNKKLLPAYSICARIYMIKKDFSNFEKCYIDAIENGLECFDIHFEWGLGLINFFKFDKAKDHFEKAKIFPTQFENPDIGIALINAYNNDFSLFETVNKKDKNNSYIQEIEGLNALKNNEFEKAIYYFKSALETDKFRHYNYLNIARTYIKLNNYDKTKEYYEEFYQKNPDYIPGIIEYSKWLIDNQNFNDAQRKLRKAQKKDENNPDILNLLFLTQYTLVKENISEYNLKEAIATANKAEQLGNFNYTPQKTELECELKKIKGNKIE